MASRSLQLVFLMLVVSQVELSFGSRIGPAFMPQIRVLGSVFCDSCSDNRYTNNSIIFQDANAVLECKNKDGTFQPHAAAKSNKRGEFVMELMSQVSIRDCSVKIVVEDAVNECEISSFYHALSPQTTRGSLTTYEVPPFVYKTKEPLSFCPPNLKDAPMARRSAITTNSYHLGPPDPPQPFYSIDKKRFTPPHPGQGK